MRGEPDIKRNIFHRVKCISIIFRNVRIRGDISKTLCCYDCGHVCDQHTKRFLLVRYIKYKTVGTLCMTEMMQHNQLRISKPDGVTIFEQAVCRNWIECSTFAAHF